MISTVIICLAIGILIGSLAMELVHQSYQTESKEVDPFAMSREELDVFMRHIHAKGSRELEHFAWTVQRICSASLHFMNRDNRELVRDGLHTAITSMDTDSPLQVETTLLNLLGEVNNLMFDEEVQKIAVHVEEPRMAVV